MALARNVTLGGTRYILVEFPRLVAYDTVTNALPRSSTRSGAGAGPPRAVQLLFGPRPCAGGETLGAKMQVDATTLLTPQARGQRARAAGGEGLADILAGDNHGDERTSRPAPIPPGAGRRRAGGAARAC